MEGMRVEVERREWVGSARRESAKRDHQGTISSLVKVLIWVTVESRPDTVCMYLPLTQSTVQQHLRFLVITAQGFLSSLRLHFGPLREKRGGERYFEDGTKSCRSFILKPLVPDDSEKEKKILKRGITLVK